MNLRQPLTLPILWNSDSSQLLKDIGLESSEMPEIRRITFYTIDHAFSYKYEKFFDEEITCVFSGGIEYLCSKTIDELNLEIMACL